VVNIPLSIVSDALGAEAGYDPSFVGCYPDPLAVGPFGCGWEDDFCPPGFIAVFGTPQYGGAPAIADLNSVYDYAQAALGDYVYVDSVELGPNGVTITFPENFFDSIADSIPREAVPPLITACLEAIAQPSVRRS
jgi:hypothetical protein